MNAGYEEVRSLVANVMGFNEWLVDVEPIEAIDDKEYGHNGGMNFSINWPNLNEKTRMCIRYNNNNTYDVQLFQYQGYKQTGLQIEKEISRDGMLVLLSTLYQEIVSLSNEVLEAHIFELSKETKEILKEL